jgi:hypothetical protein
VAATREDGKSFCTGFQERFLVFRRHQEERIRTRDNTDSGFSECIEPRHDVGGKDLTPQSSFIMAEQGEIRSLSCGQWSRFPFSLPKNQCQLTRGVDLSESEVARSLPVPIREQHNRSFLRIKKALVNLQ